MAQAPRSSGTTWKIIGVALLVLGVVGGTALPGPINSMNYKFLLPIPYILPLLLGWSGAFLYWRGRQYAAQRLAESVIPDAKPHLLYLRPFRSDFTIAKALFHGLEKSEEEQLADVLQPFGELEAIGRPGESLPTPGAARIYASDDEWRDVVKRQMQASRLVVIRAGVGENVLWELTQAVRSLEPQKLLILVLKMKAQDYESFRTKANPILGVSLPDQATLWRFGRLPWAQLATFQVQSVGYWKVSGFISFAANWKPNFLALKAPYFRSGSFRRLAKYALRPVFENFGLEWQPPPISVVSPFGLFCVVGGVLAIIVTLLLAALGIHKPPDQIKNAPEIRVETERGKITSVMAITPEMMRGD